MPLANSGGKQYSVYIMNVRESLFISRRAASDIHTTNLLYILYLATVVCWQMSMEFIQWNNEKKKPAAVLFFSYSPP